MLVSGRAISSTAQMQRSGLVPESKAVIVLPSYMIVTHQPAEREGTKVALVEVQQVEKVYKKTELTDRACFLKNLLPDTDAKGNKQVVAEGRKFVVNDTAGKYISSVAPSEIREASLLLCFDSGNLLAEELTRDAGRWDDYAIYQLSYDLESAKVEAKKLNGVYELLSSGFKAKVLSVPHDQANKLGIGLLLAGEQLVVESYSPKLTGKPSTLGKVVDLNISLNDSSPVGGYSCCS